MSPQSWPHSAARSRAFWGILFIAFTVAAVYCAASLRWTVLIRKPIQFGLPFGAAVYLVMTYLVLPLSAVPKSPFSLGLFLNGIIGHALFVGLPIALYARTFIKPLPLLGSGVSNAAPDLNLCVTR